MKIRTILHIIGIFMIFQSASAQIKGVSYQLKFNEKTNLFDCYLVIKKGQAISPVERIQFNAQITLMVPSGSDFKIIQNHMPMQHNRSYDGYTPMPWNLSNKTVSPQDDAAHDYLSIVPQLSPAAYYDNVQEGDEIKLFSASILPVTNCGADVKLYENKVDLNSSARGMNGGDYSNGFTVGGVEQKYTGNEVQITPSLDVIDQIIFKETKTSNVISLEMKQDAAYGPFTYEWSGPNHFTNNYKNIKFNSITPFTPGMYQVEVTDSRGCKQIRSIEPSFKNMNLTHQTNEGAADDIDPLTLRVNPVAETVNIFPNPAINFFTLSIIGENGTEVAVDIRDMSGRMIRNNIVKSVIRNNKSESNINLQDIAPGIYNVTVDMKGKVSTHKLIVVK